MRVVLQRVTRAEVRVEGRPPARIGHGVVLLVGLEQGDGEAELSWMVRKLAGLRVFDDDAGRMNQPLSAVQGRCLVVSQFTLLGDCRKGRRPSYDRAMAPSEAAIAFQHFLQLLEKEVGPLATGVFGAYMEVELVGDGPVTLILERRPKAG